MNDMVRTLHATQKADPGLTALCGIAAFYRIVADPAQLQRELNLPNRLAACDDILRAAKRIGLRPGS